MPSSSWRYPSSPTSPGKDLPSTASPEGAVRASPTPPRTLGLDEGVDRFLAHPIKGDGLVDLFDIHNNFLEVAVAIGIFGLAGYLLVLYAFARPIFGKGELRRLCYPVWGYIGFGATVPSLYDRSIWTVVALSVVAMLEFERLKTKAPTSATEPPPLRLETSSGAAS